MTRSSPKHFVYNVDEATVKKIFLFLEDYRGESVVYNDTRLNALRPNLIDEGTIRVEDTEYGWIDVERVTPFSTLQDVKDHEREMCDTLAALHDLGYAHGDPRWSNFATRGEDIVLFDFESSVRHRNDTSKTENDLRIFDESMRAIRENNYGILQEPA